MSQRKRHSMTPTEAKLMQQLEELKRKVEAMQTQGKPGPKPKVKKPEPDWDKVLRTCPQCGREGTVAAMFGTRPVRGERKPQSWCSKCRAEMDYRQRERVYTK